MHLRRKRGIRTKILNLILTSTVVIFLITITVISINNRRASLKDAFALTDTYSKQFSNEVIVYLEEYMDVARSISSIFEGKDSYPTANRRQIFMNVLRDILIDNPHFLAAWTIWEPNAVDGLDSIHISKPGCTYIGSFSTTFFRDKQQIKLENSGTTGVLFIGDYYTIPKSTKKESILDPFYYSYTGIKKDEILQTNMIVPILSNQKFLGVVGIDAALGSFKEIIKKIKPFKNGYAFIIANDGSIVAHPDEKNIGLNFEEFAKEINTNQNVVKKVKEGDVFSFSYNENNEKYYYSFSPILIGDSETPWALAVVVPYKSILTTVNRVILISSIIGLLGIIILAIILNFVSNRISKPLTEISNEMQKLNAADVKKLDEIAQNEKNEIGTIATSSQALIDWINRTGEFAKSIGEGDYDYEYKLFNGNDVLGKSLIEMRNELKNAQEEAKIREIENEKRTWAAQGIAKINDVIRRNNDNLENLYYHIISELVQYVDAIQGGLFLIERDENREEILELKASYAYNRRKFLTKRISVKEGLLGECILGREKILLSEIPDNYVEIVSGLGGSNPRHLLISPLIFNEKVYGVVEIASFNEIEQHTYNFVESVSETIASTISMIKTNVQTSGLLEKSQIQAEELESRERELQQNLEELKAVHEQMDSNAKKVEEREFNVISILDGILDGIITCDKEGNIVDMNPEFLRYTGYTKTKEGKSIFDIFAFNSFNDLKINSEQVIKLIKSDKTKENINVKISKINKKNDINFLFLIHTK